MAIINNNVQNVKFLRNGSVFTPSLDPVKTAREVAKDAMDGQLTNLSDGTAILGRYQETNGTVKTLVGFAYVSGGTKTLTIIDVEGASADVEALRTEINNKLGNGVGSGETETVTAQLTALSGTAGASSAETSVEGAKSYAKDYTDEQISGLDYSGITTSDAAVVTNVTQADGKVAATSANVGGLKLTDYTKGSDSGAVASTDSINDAFSKVENQIDAEAAARAAAIEALDYTDTAVTKQFVAAVDETDGKISVTRGELQSSGKTIVITADGNNVNFEANIDGVTLEKDANGVISVTSSALVQYEGDDDTIQIGAVSDGKRIVSSPLTIQKVTTGLSEEVKEEYHLIGHSGNTIGDPVKIYKDSHIVSINYITTGEHAQNLEYVYIDVSGNTQTTYVDMSELVLEAEFASGVTITDHVAHGVVDPTSETFLTVGASGFKLAGVQDAINTAVGGLDADVSGNSTHVTVGVVEEDGVITGVTVSEDNIANADDLATLSGKTVTAITSTNGSITASIDDAAGNKTYDIVTDADKIKMSGFSAEETTALSGIAESDSIATAFEKTNAVITENEEVTSAALNDLEEKIEELSGSSVSGLTEEIASRQRVDGITGSAYTATASANYISAATSLNDADQKLDAAIKVVEGDLDVVETNYVSGMTVNGSALTKSDRVLAVNVTSATGATTATSTEAITVETDATGNITLGLANIDCGTY